MMSTDGCSSGGSKWWSSGSGRSCVVSIMKACLEEVCPSQTKLSLMASKIVNAKLKFAEEKLEFLTKGRLARGIFDGSWVEWDKQRVDKDFIGELAFFFPRHAKPAYFRTSMGKPVRLSHIVALYPSKPHSPNKQLSYIIVHSLDLTAVHKVELLTVLIEWDSYTCAYLHLEGFS
ncbi:hypothetical protein NE237_000785 [Protea cynaroides]|uniref:Uncharacterized protein n=1 Tax=Protea cynaroides TaxID=273540 RepID=A0A9Q0KS86_9MAGN|nr:hypothetical protein NE237_000785 [Protea cynaroides]